ncbi:MAG: hypothetical protein ACT4QE_24910, partial [Anaerolineales bacterium]
FVCNMNTLSAEDRQRHETVFGKLRASLIELAELPSGYAFHLPPDQSHILLAAEFITRERECCPFLSFAVHVEPEGQPMALHLTGPEGVKPFLREELGLG